jgi:peptide/nickel transport system substrate-binding protein
MLAGLMIGSLASCGSSSDSTSQDATTDQDSTANTQTVEATTQSEPVTINVGVRTNFAVTSLEVTRVESSNATWTLVPLLFDYMFYINSDGEMQSDIFESYSYSDDHLELTLKLRDDIYFSNGDQKVGEDILYTISRNQQNSGATYYTCINLDKSTVSDDGLTVTLVYDYEYGPGLTKLDMAVVNKSFYESLGDLSAVDWYDPKNVCGSGPYQIDEYVQDNYAVLSLREDRWNTEREYTVDQFRITSYTDQTTMFVDFENGVVDLAINISSSDAQRLADGLVENGALGLIDSNCTVILQFNENNEYLADPVVREAICLAIPTDELTEVTAGVYGETAGSTAGRNMACYVDGYTYDYDPEYAKQLLEDAGYEDGEITLTFVTTSETEQTTFAEGVQAYLDKIGINVDIQTYDTPTALPMWQQGQTDLQRYTSSDGIPDLEPYMAFSVFQEGSAFPACAKSDAALNEALEAGYQNLDEETRTAAYQEVQKILYEGYWCLPVYEWKGGYAYNPDKFEEINLLSIKRHDLTQIVAAR